MSEIITLLETNHTITRIQDSKNSCDYLKKVMFYKIQGYSDQLYLKNIYVYQNNRFIMKIQTKSDNNICGFIILKETINVGILRDRVIHKEIGDLITNFVDAEIAKGKVWNW